MNNRLRIANLDRCQKVASKTRVFGGRVRRGVRNRDRDDGGNPEVTRDVR